MKYMCRYWVCTVLSVYGIECVRHWVCTALSVYGIECVRCWVCTVLSVWKLHNYHQCIITTTTVRMYLTARYLQTGLYFFVKGTHQACTSWQGGDSQKKNWLLTEHTKRLFRANTSACVEYVHTNGFSANRPAPSTANPRTLQSAPPPPAVPPLVTGFEASICRHARVVR
jgi:hypothetical protein